MAICWPFGKTCLFITGERSSPKAFCVTPNCTVTAEDLRCSPLNGGREGEEGMRGWGAGDAETDSEKAGEGRTGGGRGRLGPALSPPAPGLSLPSGSTLRGQAPWLGILRAPASHLGRHSVSQVQGWALLSEEPGHPPPPSLLRGPPPARWRHQLQRSRLPRAWEIRFPLPGRGTRQGQ